MIFSDTTRAVYGIVQKIESKTNTQSATAYSYPLAEKTADVNAALGNFMILANQAAGRWQVDDSNHTDYAIVFGDIVSGQQDYSFTVDENGNQILDIYKVRAKDSAGNWNTLTQRDLQDGNDEPLNSTTTTTAPNKYDLTANGIFLTDIPSYASTDGLELFVSRTPSYFTVSDTTKEPGIPHIFHEYLVIRPSYFYCLSQGLPQASGYGNALIGMEESIKDYYGSRNRDEKRRLTPMYQNNR